LEENTYPSLGPKIKPSKKPEDAGSKQSCSACHLLLLVNPEDGSHNSSEMVGFVQIENY
jgi:hypothetical protein